MKDLRYMYSVHQARTVIERSSTKDIKHNVVDSFVVTPSGRYEETTWRGLLIDQAKQLCELDIIDKLKEYNLDKLAWIKLEKDAYDYALELYSNRIHENKEWLGYDEFQAILNINTEAEQISLF